MRRATRKRRGFTLIEILIVVVILGILAAIVVPQFTNASQEATASSIRSQLQTLRGQIELYRVRNGGTLPASFDELMNPPAGQAPYLTQAPVAPTNWDYVFGDNDLTDGITETIHVTCSQLPEGITQDDINGW
ncbi:MAG: PilD-dependent protein PddA [Planctomycetota bacterium]|jgi:type II secretion system protein G